jgi:uncharacterized protein (DUF1330 family)
LQQNEPTPELIQTAIDASDDPSGAHGTQEVAGIPAYVIYQGEVTDADRYEVYKGQAAESIHAAGGRYLARGGDIEVLEGDAPAGRTVLLEFPTMDDAIAWYRGQRYTEVRKLREGAATARMYVVEGVA